MADRLGRYRKTRTDRRRPTKQTGSNPQSSLPKQDQPSKNQEDYHGRLLEGLARKTATRLSQEIYGCYLSINLRTNGLGSTRSDSDHPLHRNWQRTIRSPRAGQGHLTTGGCFAPDFPAALQIRTPSPEGFQQSSLAPNWKCRTRPLGSNHSSLNQETFRIGPSQSESSQWITSRQLSAATSCPAYGPKTLH
jgi:hypothetical protein